MPEVVALNKADSAEKDHLEREQMRMGGVAISAVSGQGLPWLRSVLADTLQRQAVAEAEQADLARQERLRIKAELERPSSNLRLGAGQYPHD
jgi:50S ribosomal subunit-associated GTPase HflX